MLNFDRTYVLPFKYNIPNYILVHLSKIKLSERVLKFLRRYLYILIKGQKNLEIFKILPEHKKILWINASAPSLGDSLMDLSSRVLLKDKSIDLFTDKKNSSLYEDDQCFNNVYTNLQDVGKSKYDLIIMDSYSSRSIKIKSKVAPKTTFVGIYGYFNGPEVNRILFSFHQMNNLLGYVNSEIEIIKLARNSLSVSIDDQEIVRNIIPDIYIAISLGGEWEYKTYKKWGEVISQLLSNNKNLKIIFIGSENAKNNAIELLDKFPNNFLLNFTSRLSFNQTAEVIRQAQVFLCCDGGLMHAAAALDANFVSLLARLTPEMLLTQSTMSNN